MVKKRASRRMWRWGHAMALCIALFTAQTVQAEWYTGLYTGVNFADDLHNVEGTNGLEGLRAPDFDLKNSVVYGAKLGNYFGNGSFGVEGEVFNSTPHVKNLDDIPGFHLRVTTLALNIVARIPGRTVQPYGGMGFALLLASMGKSATTRSDSDVAPAFNLFAGIRFFLTPYTALFTEYKGSVGTLHFDDAFVVGGGFAAEYLAHHVVAGVTYHF